MDTVYDVMNHDDVMLILAGCTLWTSRGLMNLVSHLRRRRRSKNTRTESGLIRVNYFCDHIYIIVPHLVLIIVRIQNLYIQVD